MQILNDKTIYTQSTSHAASKLAKMTFNKFTPPPQKKRPFCGGGGKFFGIFSWIFGFGTQKKIWKDFGAKSMFCNSKNLGFSVFLGKFGNFFLFKIQFWTKLVLEPLKMVFLIFFKSWRWFTSIFYPFLSFYNFEFLCIFYVEICRFRQFWRNMCRHFSQRTFIKINNCLFENSVKICQQSTNIIALEKQRSFDDIAFKNTEKMNLFILMQRLDILDNQFVNLQIVRLKYLISA